jgi:hypothetical protein
MGSATTPSPLEFTGARFILLEQLRGKPALQARERRASIRCFQARRGESPVKSVFTFEPYRNDDQRAYRNGRPGMDSGGPGQAGGGIDSNGIARREWHPECVLGSKNEGVRRCLEVAISPQRACGGIGEIQCGRPQEAWLCHTGLARQESKLIGIR